MVVNLVGKLNAFIFEASNHTKRKGNYIQFYTMTKIKNGLFVAIIACFVAVSCVRETAEIAPVDTPEFFVKIDGDSIGFDLYVIDSCEYIGHLAGTSNSSVDFFVHKGNCRFCKERQSLFHSKAFVMSAYKKDYPFLKSGN